MTNTFRRRFKNLLNNKNKNSFQRQTKPSNIVYAISALSLALFCISQLGINAMLNPLGEKLKSYDNEKNLLVEENRQLEKDIAESQSISVISEISEKKLNLSQRKTSDIVYVNPQNLRAER